MSAPLGKHGPNYTRWLKFKRPIDYFCKLEDEAFEAS